MSDANMIDAQPQGSAVAATVLRSLAAPQLGALLVVAMALTLGVGLIIWMMRPDYIPVAGQGSREDSLQIMEMLNSSQVQYKIDPSTGIVLVPQDQAMQVQMSLAASGLVSDQKSVGLELLQQEPSLGTSHFTESARYQHALETELSRTIGSMRNVESARVHLAMPKQSVFIRDREQASASIMIKAKQGRSIEDEQVDAVINLVASSIPYLESGQVTVVDQWGRLLSTGDSETAGATRDQYQYARKLEKLYSDRIESLLTPIVGAGRVRAIVTADLDFSLNEQTQESYEPDAAQLRSEQLDTQISRNGAGDAAGIPGALTNQPPGNGTVDPGEEAAANGEANGIQSENSTSVRNFELDRTITHVRQVPGSVQRISAAVIIDDRLEMSPEGEPVRTPLTEEELAEYTRLAQEAVGFSEQRGDSVVVFNRAFKPVEEILPIEPLPIWQQNWLWTMVRQVLIGLSVLLLVLLVLRPAVRKLFAASDRSQLAALEAANGGTQEDGNSAEGGSALEGKSPASLEPPSIIYGDILNMARAMAAEDPKRVAKVVKDWVAEQ